MLALVMGGAIAGLLGAILALPVTAAARDVFRYAFHRVDDPPSTPDEALAMIRAHPTVVEPGPGRGRRSGSERRKLIVPPDIDPYKVLQVDPEAEDEVIQAAYRRLAQKYHPDRQPGRGGRGADGRDQRGVGDGRRSGQAGGLRPRAGRGRARSPTPPRRRRAARGRRHERGARRRLERPGRFHVAATARAAAPAGDRLGRLDVGPIRRRRAATTPRRCGRRRGTAPRARRRAIRRARSSGSGGTRAGRSARSPVGTSNTSNGSTGWRSAGPYRDEIDVILRKAGRRRGEVADASDRRGLFRRR